MAVRLYIDPLANVTRYGEAEVAARSAYLEEGGEVVASLSQGIGLIGPAAEVVAYLTAVAADVATLAQLPQVAQAPF